MKITMRSRMVFAAAGVVLLGAVTAGQAAKTHLNPMIALHAQKKPLFGLYAPANRGNRAGGPGAPPIRPRLPRRRRSSRRRPSS